MTNKEILKVLKDIEETLRTVVTPTLATIACVTDLQAVIFHLKKNLK